MRQRIGRSYRYFSLEARTTIFLKIPTLIISIAISISTRPSDTRRHSSKPIKHDLFSCAKDKHVVAISSRQWLRYSPTGKFSQSPPFSDKKTGNAPLNSFIFIWPASPGDGRTLGQARANWRSMAAAAVSTMGRPRHACGPKPWCR